jgi:uracil-DNA glycosylase
MLHAPTDFNRAFDDVPVDWHVLTESFRQSRTGQTLLQKLHAEQAAGHTIYPVDLFAALRLTRLQQVRVVIIGQDPYHGPDQAHGLAFSVPVGMKIPPSLRNIFKEIQRDMGLQAPASGNLQAWAERGVLLLNSTLTVRAHEAASHADWGWETLTDALIARVAADAAPKVFMLWGAHAQRKRALIEAAANQHLVLMCNHPSPLSALRGATPFIGCGHFGRAQTWLAERYPDINVTPSWWAL